MLEVTTLRCGATLLGEARAALSPQTVSVCIYLPCGVVFDDDDTIGCSLLLTELFNRGTPSLPGKEFRASFERHGIHFIAGGGFERAVIRIDCLASKLETALALVATALRTPRITDFLALEESRRMLVNDIRLRLDDSAGIAAQRLSSLFFATPFNRAREGTEAGIQNSNERELASELRLSLSARSVLFAWCGAASQALLVGILDQHFDFLSDVARPVPTCFAVNTQDIKPIHIPRATEQRSLMLAFDSAALNDAGYFSAKVAALCLGGGLFSRLFNEVREKRGLVYDISCSHASNRDRGWISIGFATSPKQYAQALEITKEVVTSFVPTKSELTRALHQVKLSLAAADEARSARCETIAAEWSYRGRVRSEEELISAVNAVSEASIAELWRSYPPFRNAVEVSVGGEG